MKGITVFLWFDGQAEEAANFYTSLFPNSSVTDIAYYNQAGPGEPGNVMTVAFELDGRKFVGLNGGPEFKFNEAISFAINCETQEEVDDYWQRLGEGGEHGSCGWLKDKYGVSWQVVPTALPELLTQSDPEAAQRVLATMLKMSKLEIEPLRRAAEGREPVEAG
jgi:predicted 3-demethylubiquinone-9 3-methyltransferase (glyoxalase superfamily)